MSDKNIIIYDYNTNQVHHLALTEQLVQGQDNHVKFKITFNDIINEQLVNNYLWQVLCVFERPDGSKTNEILATLSDGKYYITLPSWITDIEGNVKLTTTILYDDGTRQPFGLVLIPVLEGVEPSTSTIEEALYDALLSTVNNINAKTEARVKKDGDTMSGDLDMDGNHIDNVGSLRVLEVVGHDATVSVNSNIDMNDGELRQVGKITGIIGHGLTIGDKLKMNGNIIDEAGHVDIDEGRQDTLTTAKSVKDYAVHRKLTIGDVELDKAINFLNAISSAEITQTLNEATENLQGALSADDKKLINMLRDLLDVDSGFVDTLQEVLDVFADYPHSTDLLTMFATKVNTTTKINDIAIGTGMTIKSKDIPFSTTNVEAELERLEGAKVDARLDADLLLDTDKAKIDKIRDNGDGYKYLADDGTYKVVSGGAGGNSNNPDGVTIVLNEDDELEVNLKYIMNGGYL